MKRTIQSYLSLLLILATTTSALSNQRYSVEEYIKKFKTIAIEEMKVSNIPASITMAQGILESSFGNSYLAREGNNHFGIKCHEWQGAKIYRDDDRANECFRKYNRAEDSYADHTRFLLEKQRYAFLFNLPPSDYKSWARGLQKAGYATDQEYGTLLIDIIEKYNLTSLDREAPEMGELLVSRGAMQTQTSTTKQKATRGTSRTSSRFVVESPSQKGSSLRLSVDDVFYYNRIKTVIVPTETTPERVARKFEMNANRLRKYNNFEVGQKIPAQTKVFLQPKRSLGPYNYKMITVEEGMTMETISQQYGVRINKLYKRNRMIAGEQPVSGQVLYLRGKNPLTPVVHAPQDVMMVDNKFYRQTGEDTWTGAKKGAVRHEYEDFTTSRKERNKVAKQKESAKKETVSKTRKTETYNDWTGVEREVKTQDSFTGRNAEQKTVQGDWSGDEFNTQKKGDFTGRSINDREYSNWSGNSTTPSGEVRYYEGDFNEAPTKRSTKTQTTTTQTTRKQYVPAEKVEQVYVSTNKQSNTTSANNDMPVVRKTYTEVVNTTSTVNSYGSGQLIAVYIVKPKDTLYSLSKKYGTSVESIQRRNGLINSDIKIGQELKIYQE